MKKWSSVNLRYVRDLLIVACIFWLTIGSFKANNSVILAPPAANVDPQWITLIDAATGTGTELECGGAQQVALEFESASGVTAGTIALEHSAVGGYSGVWANLDLEDFAVIGGGAKAFFTYPGPLGRLRPRVTVNFTGGGGPKVTVRAKRMF